MNLTSGATTDYLFAVKESRNFTGTRTPADLQNVSSSGQVYNDTTKQGWYIQMPGAGEKVLSDSTVFGGILYFTSYLPPTGSDPCSLSGTSNLYGLNYITGGGALDSGGSKVRSTFIGNGMVMSPSISFDPSGRTDMFLTSSNGTGPWNPHINFGNTGKGTNLLFWNDKRIIP